MTHLSFEFSLKYLFFAVSTKCALMLAPVSLTMKLSRLLGLDSRTWGWSNSATSPWFITRMRSESMMVLRRWAMVRTVHEANWRRMVVWIKLSVLKKEKLSKLKFYNAVKQHVKGFKRLGGFGSSGPRNSNLCRLSLIVG